MRKETPTSANSGSCDPNSNQAVQTHQESPSSAPPSTSSKRRYRQPKTALQLAAQVSHVATGLLNGTIELEVAKSYGTIARTAAQAMSIEVQTGRFLKTGAVLEMPVDDVLLDEDELEADQ